MCTIHMTTTTTTASTTTTITTNINTTFDDNDRRLVWIIWIIAYGTTTAATADLELALPNPAFGAC